MVTNEVVVFFIHEFYHLAIGLALYLSLSKIIPGVKYAILALIVALILDADHLFDYFMALGFQLNLDAIFQGSYFDYNNKIYVLLHSWELATILFILGWVKKLKEQKRFLIATSMGILSHLIADQVWYQSHPLGYFLLARFFHNFTPAYFW